MHQRAITGLLAAIAITMPVGGQTTWYVDDDNCPGPGDGSELDPYCSIQTAIDNAVGGDEIVVAPGTYNEIIDFVGKAVTLRSSDGPEVTTIDATGIANFPVVRCASGEGPLTVLKGFTVTGLSGCCLIAGMLIFNSSPTVTNCTFSGNSNLNTGGGMLIFSNSSPTVTNCTFSGNSAGLGGGMYNYSGSTTVTNCTFSGNSAGQGGGMYNNGGSPTVTNCILWNNSPDELSGGGTPSVTYSNVQGGFPGTGNIDADPLFVDPGNGDFRLSPDSPCIDAGDNTTVPEGIITDLDGNPRFVDNPDTVDTGNGDPPIVDMGAYEFQLCPCDCEATPDGTVDAGDFLALLAQWGTPGSCDCETPPDGAVDAGDFLALLAAWGACP